MIWGKYILTFFFIVMGSIEAFATPQAPNILVYNGDTIFVFLNVLPDEFYKIDTVTVDSSNNKYINHILNVNLFGDKKGYFTTACWAGFRSAWEIVENQLYLTGIYSCCYNQDSLKADLTSLFKEKAINGKVKADWINSDVTVKGGKELTFFYNEIPVFKKEIEFVFQAGKLINIQTFDNSKSRESAFHQNQNKMISFIYSNIDWDNLPAQQMPLRVIAKFSANEDGKIDEVEVMRKSDHEIFNQEAVRVIKLIPDWDVLLIRGQLYRHSFFMPITFSKENREKYGK